MKKTHIFLRVIRWFGLAFSTLWLAGCYSTLHNAPIVSVTGQPITFTPTPTPPNNPPAEPPPPPPQPVSPPPATQPVPTPPSAPAQPPVAKSPDQPAPAKPVPSQPVSPQKPVASGSTQAPSGVPQVPRAKDAGLVTWKWPTQGGQLLQSFNQRQCQNSPSQMGSGCGIDIGGQAGQPIYAATSGRVNYAGSGIPGLGNLIIISSNKGFIVAYAHLQKIKVRVNDYVQAGQLIGTMGQTDAPSPRLHMEVRRDGSPQNPLSYLPKP